MDAEAEEEQVTSKQRQKLRQQSVWKEQEVAEDALLYKICSSRVGYESAKL